MVCRKLKRSEGRMKKGYLAEAVRFELTNGFPLPVFKTGAIDHSATLPSRVCLSADDSNQLYRVRRLSLQWFLRQKQSLQITQHVKAAHSGAHLLQIPLNQA